jgi:RND family efflux transporter MFP subunit
MKLSFIGLGILGLPCAEVFVEKGQFVRPGERLVRLTDLSRVEVPVALPLDDFLQLEQDLNAGRKPPVTLAPNETTAALWNGAVVRAAPEADPVSRTVQVFVEVDNDQKVPLLPGTFVHARINGQAWTQTRLIPREAVVEGQVYVVDDQNIARRRPVTIGRRLQSLAIVTDGLNAGDRVILTNLDIVEEGTQLVVQDVLNVTDELQSLRTPVIRLTENSPL